jgi:hypothetical protein
MTKQSQTQEGFRKTETRTTQGNSENIQHEHVKTRKYNSATSIHSRFSSLQSAENVYYFRYDPQERQL